MTQCVCLEHGPLRSFEMNPRPSFSEVYTACIYCDAQATAAPSEVDEDLAVMVSADRIHSRDPIAEPPAPPNVVPGSFLLRDGGPKHTERTLPPEELSTAVLSEIELQVL